MTISKKGNNKRMQIDIRGVETVLTKEVKAYAEEKANKLSKYGVDIMGIELALEEDHNKTEDRAGVAKALIKISGKNISVKGEGKNVFAAIDEMERKASRELRKAKDRKDPKRFAKSKEVARRLFRRG
ncbi:ribosome-associated translation inhibitor RaiA [candidate division WS5 bacterium]|uniref:Ribosome-associated translation inhibitor RaiA n=1 Tax=candidate division WS5 bacterium TaxID=2093353 RepID=A0A419DA56_9BACT|nr:MAG: ribosome-associated translation inhibitor RaiA [candidate division WS5 bacterium]